MAYTFPSDTHVGGDAGHITDHNNLVDVLTGMGSVYNVLNTAYAGGADPTGTNDSAAAFQAAISALPAGGGTVYVPPGTYKINTALTPVSGLWLHGTSYQSTKLTSAVSSLFVMDPGTQLDVVEIDHLSLEVTGAFPIFSKMWITRSSVHHCYLQAHNAGAAIWFSNTGTGYMAECRFYENREQVWGATRTVSPWHLEANNTGTLFQVNDNTWHDIVCFNNDKDTAFWWYRLIQAGAFAGVTNNANTLRDITFEFPTAGMVRLESCSYTTLERLTSEDFASSPVGNQQISVVKNANGGASQNTIVRDYTRRGGAVAITDVQLDANCIATEVDGPALTGASGGSVLTIDLGGSTGNTLTAVPASAVILNPGTFTDHNRQLLSPNGIYKQPTGATGATMPRHNVTAQWTLPTSGSLQLVAIELPTSLAIASLTFVSGTTVKAGGTHLWYVLLDSARVVRAVSADQTDAATTFGAAGTANTLAMTSGGTYTTTYSGLYYAGIMVAATTMPSVASSAVFVASGNIAALVPIMCGTSSTGQTTPPALGATMAGITPNTAAHMYAYTS